ncbi:MAG: Rrf2 family transcriptional regulator [Microscillaceae bacterium]|nr:Rrf2 family transcriptional regulator [Microscillaceae bacterium]MDW8459646.1 Rrf2 family transcriptional regulator [Cytophagales bacterium]
MLSKKVKYALKALTYLAHKRQEAIEKQAKEYTVLISEIAEAERIPKKFLETILLELRKAGYLASRRGKGGGYFLLKKPEEINLANIIRLFDGAIALVPCVSLNYYRPCEECIDENTCGMKAIFLQVRIETIKILTENTLQNIVENEINLKNILKIQS